MKEHISDPFYKNNRSRKIFKNFLTAFTLICLTTNININNSNAQNKVEEPVSPRNHLLMDFDWRFALGHSYDTEQDFKNGSSYFSYFAKAGYGDGPANKDFDDRAWRILDLPHDWCVELPFDSTISHSHGYKAIGRSSPENSVGWYRKKFFIPESDLGKRISIEFDGVHRNSIVWVNGFYLGTEHSGYTSFSYDITEYLNYGGNNVVAVRVDAAMEEGWYYEGAGIYRHVWLTKTSPLHAARYGTFVTTDLNDNTSVITCRTTVINESNEKSIFDIEEIIFDAEGKSVASGSKKKMMLDPGEQKEFFSFYNVKDPKIWSIGNPYLYKLKTIIRLKGKITDTYETTFGIRTVRFDPDEGFFLNGKNIKILGTNVHQDHAGVGTAIPDALQTFRIKRLKEMGSNAIRTSHNPPTPELLDICDRLGMLVLDENRLMGINEEHFSCLERLIKRDRNHPSVILWSLGNEEWAIEGNIKGAHIVTVMQNFAHRLDSSRSVTAASSGGWDTGIGTVVEVMGYNYLSQGNIDEHHSKFPWQPGVGTEESNVKQTRGVYKTVVEKAHMQLTNFVDSRMITERGWKFYAERPFLAGLFYWTGFDYRGESNPYLWPAVINQSGMVDLCGYPKDIFYYLKSWWGKDPVLHILPHWNQAGDEGKEIKTYVFSNCEEVELLLNNKSLGTKNMPLNGYLEWDVNYQPGILSAKGYKNGKEIITNKTETAGEEKSIQLAPDRKIIKADGEDISVITVQVNDENGLMVPTASNDISFSIEGGGKIIGVGNGDPSSHEADRYFNTIKRAYIKDMKEFPVDDLSKRPEVAAGFEDSDWAPAFSTQSDDWQVYTDSLIVVRGTFELREITDETEVNLFTKSIVENQSIYVNGHLIESNIARDDPHQAWQLDHKIIKTGKNDYAVVGQRFRKKHRWDEPNTDPGLVQVIYPAEKWKRKVFNGLAQVIVQSTKTKNDGEIILTATSPDLESATIKIKTKKTELRPTDSVIVF
jgi:beta-galactosidase